MARVGGVVVGDARTAVAEAGVGVRSLEHSLWTVVRDQEEERAAVADDDGKGRRCAAEAAEAAQLGCVRAHRKVLN